MLNQYKQAAIILTIVLIIILGTVNYVKDLIGQPPESAPEHLQVKAPAEKILHSQKIKDEQGNDIVKYLYASETEVPAKTIKIDEQEIKEDISKRTKNAQFFKKAVNKDNNQNADTQNGSTAPVAAGDNGAVAANESEKEVWVGRFYAGEPFYKDAAENKWYQTETATTTAEEFAKQTKPNFLAKLKAFFNINALADTGSYYAGAGDGVVGLKGAFLGSWDSVHDAGTGSYIYDTIESSNYTMSAEYSGLRYSIYRAFFPFDLSATSGVVTACDLKIYGYGAMSSVSAQEGTQADTLTLADFDSCNPLPSTGGGEFGHVTWVTEEYNTISFNNSGKSFIEGKFGDTAKIICREYDLDYLDGNPNNYYYDNGSYFSEQTGTDKDPYLEVTYTVPAAPAKFRFDGGQMKIQGKVKFE